MPRKGISYDEVAIAATQLLGSGKHPSVNRVRRLLGTGSNTTISRHLQAWRDSFKQGDVTRLPVPNTATANDTHHDDGAPSGQETDLPSSDEKITIVGQNLTEPSPRSHSVQSELSDARNHIADLESALDRALDQYAGAQEQIASIEHQAEHTVNLSTQLLKANEMRVAELERQLERRKKADKGRLSELTQQLAEERTRAAKNETRLTQRIHDLEREANAGRDPGSTTTDGSESATLATLKTQLAKQQAEVRKYQDLVLLYKGRLEYLRQRYKTLKDKHEETLTSEKSLQAELTDTKSFATSLERRVEELQVRLCDTITDF